MINSTIGWSESMDNIVHVHDEALQYIDIAEFKNYRGQFDNIFDFLDQNSGSKSPSLIILQDALLHFATESNIRVVLARLVKEGAEKGLAVVLEKTNHPNFISLERAVRCLGLNLVCQQIQFDDIAIFIIKRNQKEQDLSLWKIPYPPELPILNLVKINESILDSLQKSNGLSLIRIGHCEIKFIGYGDNYGRSDVQRSSQIQWGGTISQALTYKIQSQLCYAVAQSDIIGVNPRTTWGGDQLKILEASGLPILLRKGLLEATIGLVNPNIHYKLGVSFDFFDTLKQADEIVLISPRVGLMTNLEKAFNMHGKITTISIPGEFRTDGDVNGSIEKRFLSFDRTLQQIEILARPRVIFLIGAGLIGKFWCARIKEKGGIAIDLGSTLDAWANIDTRGSGFSAELKGALFRYNKTV